MQKLCQCRMPECKDAALCPPAHRKKRKTPKTNTHTRFLLPPIHFSALVPLLHPSRNQKSHLRVSKTTPQRGQTHTWHLRLHLPPNGPRNMSQHLRTLVLLAFSFSSTTSPLLRRLFILCHFALLQRFEFLGSD